MGNYFTVNMEENFKRNQDFITEMNTIKVRATHTYFGIYCRENKKIHLEFIFKKNLYLRIYFLN